MNTIKIVIVSALIISNASFAQLPQVETGPSTQDITNLPKLKDWPASSYSPKMIEYKGSDVPEDEVLGILFSTRTLFEMILPEQDFELFQMQVSTLDSNANSMIARDNICFFALSIDGNNPSINEAEELAEKLIKIDSDYSERIISMYSDLIQSSSDFAIQVYENYRQYIQFRIVTKKIDYDYESINNSIQFIQNQKDICSNI